jgi:hypothetical protein
MSNDAQEYEVKVVVHSLDEAGRLMKVLGDHGFRGVSMSGPSASHSVAANSYRDSRAALANFNELIIGALRRAGAVDRRSAATVEQMVEALKTLRSAEGVFRSRPEGVVSRTVSMVASAVLADKYSWVAYDPEEPRRFWLTERGLERARLLSGEASRQEEEAVRAD